MFFIFYASTEKGKLETMNSRFTLKEFYNEVFLSQAAFLYIWIFQNLLVHN